MSGSDAGCRPGERTVVFYTDARAWPGGAEVYATGLMRWLRSAGWGVRLFTSDREATRGWVELLREEGFAVGLFRPTREVDPRGAAEATRMFRGSPLVHFNKTDSRTCLPAIGAARRAGAMVVVSTEHVTRRVRSHYPLGAELVTAMVRAANRCVDRILVVSEASRREYLENFRCRAEKVVTIRGGVDLSRFAHLPDRETARRAVGLPPDAIVAVSVGRLCRGKGQDAAIAATALARGAVTGLKLLLVGDGEMRSELQALVRDRGLAADVVFAGHRSDVDVVLAAADLLVQASESETLSLTVLEAMAAGLPVVSTDCGGPREIVEDGVTGRLVPTGDPGALADAITGVLRSADRGAAMGRAGRLKAAAEFDVRTTYARTASLYEELLSSAGGRSG
jgi:glycosyltransferase involved in cell wall biosynthesis